MPPVFYSCVMRWGTLLAAVAVAGCAAQPHNDMSAVNQFRVDTTPAIEKMGAAFNQVSDASRRQDWATAQDGCEQLNGARLDLESHLPAPVEELTGAIRNLTHTLADSVEKCRGFGTRNTEADVAEWNRLVHQADADTRAATQIMNG